MIRAKDTARVGDLQIRFSGHIGLFVHRAARNLRRLVTVKVDRAQSNIAVMCLGFLRYGHSQAIGLREAGLNVTLYYVDRDTEFAVSRADRELFVERARAAGVEVVRVPRRRVRTLIQDTIWLHRDLRRRQIALAVIQSHIDPRYATIGLALPVALMLHDPQAHSGDILASLPWPMRIISRIAELTSFCIVIHSSLLLEQIRPVLRRVPIAVVPHGADMASVPVSVPGKRRLLVFGRLFAYKGIDTALDAFRALHEQMGDAELIVAGRGPLAQLARGQPNVVVRDEYIPESEIDTLLGSSRLVLLPYKDATQSGVGLQAVARGIPCIVSSAGGLPDLVPHSSSTLIVPPDDPERLTGAILQHIDHDSRLRDAVYDHARVNFAWSVVAHKLIDELRQNHGLSITAPISCSTSGSGPGSIATQARTSRQAVHRD